MNHYKNQFAGPMQCNTIKIAHHLLSVIFRILINGERWTINIGFLFHYHNAYSTFPENQQTSMQYPMEAEFYVSFHRQ